MSLSLVLLAFLLLVVLKHVIGTSGPTRAPTFLPTALQTQPPIVTVSGYFQGIYYYNSSCGSDMFAQLNYRFPGPCEPYNPAGVPANKSAGVPANKYFRKLILVPVGIVQYKLQFLVYLESDCSGKSVGPLDASIVTNSLDVPLDDSFANGLCYNASTTPFQAPFLSPEPSMYPISYRFQFFASGAPPWEVRGYTQFEFDNSTACSKFTNPLTASYRLAYGWIDDTCVSWGYDSQIYKCYGEQTQQAIIDKYSGNSYCCDDVSDDINSQSNCKYESQFIDALPLSSKGTLCDSSTPMKDTCMYEQPASGSNPGGSTPMPPAATPKIPTKSTKMYAKFSYYPSPNCCFSVSVADKTKWSTADCDKKGTVAPFFEQVQNLDECLISYNYAGVAISSYRVLYTAIDSRTKNVFYLQHQLYKSLDCSGPLGLLKTFIDEFNDYKYSNTTCNRGAVFLFQRTQFQSPDYSVRFQLSSTPFAIATGYTMTFSSTASQCDANRVAYTQVYPSGACVPDIFRGQSFIYICSIDKYIVRHFFPKSIDCCGGTKGCNMQTFYSTTFDCVETTISGDQSKNGSLPVMFQSLTCTGPIADSLLEYQNTQVTEWKITTFVASLSLVASLLTIFIIISLRKYNEYNLILFALMVSQTLYDVAFLHPFTFRIKRDLNSQSDPQLNNLFVAEHFLQLCFGLLVSLISNVLASTIFYTVFYSRAALLKRYLGIIFTALLLVSLVAPIALAIFVSKAKENAATQEYQGYDVQVTQEFNFTAQKAGTYVLTISIFFNWIIVLAVSLKVAAIRRMQIRTEEASIIRAETAALAQNQSRKQSNTSISAGFNSMSSKTETELPSSKLSMLPASSSDKASSKASFSSSVSSTKTTSSSAPPRSTSSSAPPRSKLLEELARRLMFYPFLLSVTQLVRLVDLFTVQTTDDDAAYQSKGYFVVMIAYAVLVPSAGFWFAIIYFRYSPGASHLAKLFVKKALRACGLLRDYSVTVLAAKNVDSGGAQRFDDGPAASTSNKAGFGTSLDYYGESSSASERGHNNPMLSSSKISSRSPSSLQTTDTGSSNNALHSSTGNQKNVTSWHASDIHNNDSGNRLGLVLNPDTSLSAVEDDELVALILLQQQHEEEAELAAEGIILGSNTMVTHGAGQFKYQAKHGVGAREPTSEEAAAAIARARHRLKGRDSVVGYLAERFNITRPSTSNTLAQSNDVHRESHSHSHSLSHSHSHSNSFALNNNKTRISFEMVDFIPSGFGSFSARISSNPSQNIVQSVQSDAVLAAAYTNAGLPPSPGRFSRHSMPTLAEDEGDETSAQENANANANANVNESAATTSQRISESSWDPHSFYAPAAGTFSFGSDVVESNGNVSGSSKLGLPEIPPSAPQAPLDPRRLKLAHTIYKGGRQGPGDSPLALGQSAKRLAMGLGKGGGGLAGSSSKEGTGP